jgi:hypothetical protein
MGLLPPGTPTSSISSRSWTSTGSGEQITQGEVRCFYDLRGEVELARRQAERTAPSVDDALATSIVLGFVHRFAQA